MFLCQSMLYLFFSTSILVYLCFRLKGWRRWWAVFQSSRAYLTCSLRSFFHRFPISFFLFSFRSFFLFEMSFEEFISQVSYFVLFLSLLPIIFFVDFLSFISHHILSRISFFTCSWEVSFTSFTNLFLSMLPILSLWAFFHIPSYHV